MDEPPAFSMQPESLESLRLFPLPETVLFPGTMLPLHIFEPRYRDMVAHALADDRIFAIAMLKPGHEEHKEELPAIHPVVGVGRITQVQKAKDGRYYLALQGIGRARIVCEHPRRATYRVARAVALEDENPARVEEVHRAVTTLRTFLVRLLTRMPNRAETLSGVLEEIRSPGALADVLCAAALESADARQAALGVTRVVERLELATDAVAELLLRHAAEEPVDRLLM